MPKRMEEALKRAADKLASKGKLRTSKKYGSIDAAKNAFVYGILRKRGYPVGRGAHGK